MGRIEQLVANVMPGDILLCRGKRDPLRQRTPDGICGFWRDAFLCLDNGEIMYCEDGKCETAPLLAAVIEEKDFGLFRKKTHLSNEEFDQVVDSIIDSLRMEYNGFHFMFNQEELIHLGYNSIGVDLTGKPQWKASPIDFDMSTETVRIL